MSLLLLLILFFKPDYDLVLIPIGGCLPSRPYFEDDLTPFGLADGLLLKGSERK